MELSWFEDLIALSRCSSFSRAAELRNITQPAFSRRIRALEQWVGKPLVDRSTHQILMTAAGEVVLDLAENVLSTLEAGRRDARQAMQASPAVRFASTHALSLTVFPQLLRAIEVGDDECPINLRADNMVACERLMADGAVDFLLCHHHPAAPTLLSQKDFRWTVIGQDRLVPVSARDVQGKALFSWPVDSDQPIPMLSFDDSSGLGRIIRAARPDIIAAARTVFTSHLAVALKVMAADKKGMAWLPQSVVETELGSDGPLIEVGDGNDRVLIDIILLRSTRELGPKAEALWQAIEFQQASVGVYHPQHVQMPP